MGFDVPEVVWSQCQSQLRSELPEQQYNTWIRPLIIQPASDPLAAVVHLLAPNRFIEDWVKNKFLARIEELFDQLGGKSVSLAVAANRSSAPVFQQSAGKSSNDQANSVNNESFQPEAHRGREEPSRIVVPSQRIIEAPAIIKSAAESSLKTNLNKNFTFDSFVEGKSNQLAFAAAQASGLPMNVGPCINTPGFPASMVSLTARVVSVAARLR